MDYTINSHLYEEKSAGDPLTHTEWNNLVSDVNAANSNVGGGGSSVVTVTDSTPSGGDATVDVAIVSGNQTVGSPNVIQLTKKKKGVNTTIVSGNNVNIEPRESVDTTKGGNISFKPGDDIEFCSHHRLTENQDEVSIKVIDGDDIPVKLQLNAAEMVLTTKDKTGDDAAVFDVTVNSAKNTRGYLKVRAKAIDLRCEDNGGIALQPKGNDSNNWENKIKFEHNGGDGKEFGTFNTNKTSIFTNEYRFNKDGVVYAVARGALETTYKTPGDPASGVKKIDYPTQADDFKDIPISDEGTLCEWSEGDGDWALPHGHTMENILSCTWEDIIKLVLYMKNNNQGPWASQS